MTAAPALSWPGTRVLLGWWRELAGRHPRQMWFGRLLMHRLEALVRVTRPRPLDLWQRALLRLAAAQLPGAPGAASPFTALHVDEQVLARLLRELSAAELIAPVGAGRWEPTAAGRHALEAGSILTRIEERRVFYFVESAATSPKRQQGDTRQRPPHFLPLMIPLAGASGLYSGPLVSASGSDQSLPLAPAPVNAEWSFDPAVLEACLHQTPEWKARFHFPSEVTALLSPNPDAPAAENWPRVILDRPEQLAVIFLLVPAAVGAAHLLGFPVRTENWALGPEPVLALGEAWPDVFPDLVEEPPPEAWRQAWQAWCQPRSLPHAEVDACRLERADHRLLIHAPPRLIERLRTARSDAVKNEAWLLAGSGRTRTAAQVELQPV